MFEFALVALGMITGILFQKYYSVGHLLHAIGVRTSHATSSCLQADFIHKRVEILLTHLRSKRVLTALAFGQSNSANFGENPRTAGEAVFNFHKGKLYAAQDPLLGADGAGGSVWTRLGDRLIATKRYDAVVWLTLGVGGSAITPWKKDGGFNPK